MELEFDDLPLADDYDAFDLGWFGQSNVLGQLVVTEPDLGVDGVRLHVFHHLVTHESERR